MCEENLKELRAIVDEMPNYNRVLSTDNNFTELYVETGYAMATNLFKDDKGRVSVVKTTMIEGTTFEYHTHDQIETLSVYEGTLILTIGKGSKEEQIITLQIGDVYTVQRGVPHKAFTPERTKMIVQIIPSPQVPKNNG